jgi:acetylornithine deacetylase/succinyl-diaminopimelate desuccinylase-like protein
LPVQQFRSLFSQHRQTILADYFDLLRIPSISSEISQLAHMRTCANWLKCYLDNSGFETELWETQENPVIFGQRIVNPEKPTVLFYGHYDVQPVDPLEQWESPPFEPAIRNGSVFARGAQDNKGQIMYIIAALRALRDAGTQFPVNVKVVIEGDEEHGSGGLIAVLDNYASQLKAEHLIVADVGFNDIRKPSLTLGLRGVLAMTVYVRGSRTDLHSEKEGLDLHFDPNEYESNFGGQPTGGEKAFSPIERVWLRPTLEINGMSGGYSGSGFKTVIPAQSVAKVSCRIVPDQDPMTIGQKVANHIRSLAPDGIEVIVESSHTGSHAVRTSRSAKIVQVAAQALTDVTGLKCHFIMEGASIHVVDPLAKVAGADPVLFGFALPTDQIHAPNEHFGIDRFENGFVTVCRILELLEK